MYKYYGALMFRILRWERYKRQEKFHHNIIKQIKLKFDKDNDKDLVLAYGAWNRNTQMRGLIPSPTCGFRRLLAKKFTVVDTPEPNTTKTCSLCLQGEMKPCLQKPHPNPKKHQEPVKLLDVRGLRHCNNEKCGVFRQSRW